MKKIIVLILLLAGATGAAFYYVAQRSAPPAGSEYYADYLPADTLAVITLLDLKGLSRTFPESALGNFFAKQTVREIMVEQGATEEAVQRYEEFYDGAADLFSNFILQQLFGDDATIAQLSPNPDKMKANPEAELRQKLIAFGTSATAASVDSIARLTMNEVSKETVNGLELTRIRLDDEDFLYGTVRAGLIILAYNPELIAAALKQKESGGGLEAHPFFIAAKKFWAESTPDRYLAKFYANAEKLRSLFAASEQKEVKLAATYMQGFNSLSGLALEHQGDFQLKTKVEYNAAALHESVRQRQKQLRSNQNLSLHLLTEKALFYGWFSGLDENLLSFADPAELEATDVAVRQQFGFSIKEIIAALGPQVGLTIGEVVSTGLFPLPKVTLFAQIQQPETTQQLVDKTRKIISAAQRFIKEKTTEAGGHPLYYWNLMPAQVAHPALAQTNKMLYFANGEADLKSLIVAEEQNGLPQAMRDVLGAELSTQISTANASAFVLRPALFSVEAQKAASWAATAFSASASTSAEKLRAELFKLMQSLDLAAGWSQTEEDHAISLLVLRKKAVQ